MTDNSNGIRKIKEVGKNDLKKKLSKPYKVVYISALALCLAVSGTTIGCCVAASQRQLDSTVYIECNFEDYNAAYNFKFGEHFSYDFVVSKWQKEKSLDSNLIYELYYDKEYKNTISKDEQIEDLSYWYWYWNFVTLSYSPNYTVYIKIITIP